MWYLKSLSELCSFGDLAVTSDVISINMHYTDAETNTWWTFNIFLSYFALGFPYIFKPFFFLRSAIFSLTSFTKRKYVRKF